METERERHIKEIQSLKKEINAFTSQLKEKNAQIKVLGERSTQLESALKQKDAEITRVNEELIVRVCSIYFWRNKYSLPLGKII